MKYIQIILLLIFSFRIIQGQTADYLIAENPSNLTIYNKYQQHISDQLRDQFVPFTPFRIVHENEILSDQITLASRVLFNHQVLFLLKNEQERYSPENNGYIKLFKNCEIYGDTIRVLKNLRVSTFKKPKELYKKNRHNYLQEGQLCKRIFKYRNLYYVKLMSDSTVFGWTLLPRNGWEINRQSNFSFAIVPENLISRLQLRIESVNQDYENMFNYFNKKYNQEKMIPNWILEISENQIQGTLNDPSLKAQLKNSNRYLMQDIDNIFLGSDFVPVFSDSSFTIKFSRKRK